MSSYIKIPIWINIMQAILILIMLGQVYMYFFDHKMMEASGISVEGNPMLNLTYEMGARTLVIALASIFVMITQNAKQYLVILFMNVIREGQEMIIDPLFPILNAPVSPRVDFGIHVAIVAIEVLAFMTIYRMNKNKSLLNIR